MCVPQVFAFRDGVWPWEEISKLLQELVELQRLDSAKRGPNWMR